MSESRFYTAFVASAGTGQAVPDAIPAADIHKQLDRILESTHLRGSLRLTRFLKFVVETALAGKPKSIKAYTIAVEALDRGCDFDPQRDPIVRVEAGRLRQALARYYAGAGRDDPLLIELPRGTYVPLFRRRDEAAPLQTPSIGLKPLAARCRESWQLHTAVTQQSKELAAQIAAARSALADSRALLQQPLVSFAGHSAPPLCPTPSPVSDNEQRSGGESSRDLLPALEPVPQRLSPPADHGARFPYAVAGKYRLHKYGRAVRIVLYVLGVLALLQAVFDIDQPLTGGRTHGLFFRALAAHTSQPQRAGSGI